MTAEHHPPLLQIIAPLLIIAPPKHLITNSPHADYRPYSHRQSPQPFLTASPIGSILVCTLCVSLVSIQTKFFALHPENLVSGKQKVRP